MFPETEHINGFYQPKHVGSPKAYNLYAKFLCRAVLYGDITTQGSETRRLAAFVCLRRYGRHIGVSNAHPRTLKNVHCWGDHNVVSITPAMQPLFPFIRIEIGMENSTFVFIMVRVWLQGKSSMNHPELIQREWQPFSTKRRCKGCVYTCKKYAHLPNGQINVSQYPSFQSEVYLHLSICICLHCLCTSLQGNQLLGISCTFRNNSAVTHGTNPPNTFSNASEMIPASKM